MGHRHKLMICVKFSRGHGHELECDGAKFSTENLEPFRFNFVVLGSSIVLSVACNSV